MIEILNSLIGKIGESLTNLFGTNLISYYTGIVRFIFPVLAAWIVYRCIRSLMNNTGKNETWAYLALASGDRIPITHWENTIGRSKSCDIVLSLPEISRLHATLNRNPDDTWQITDQNSSGGIFVNGKKVQNAEKLGFGDVITLSDLTLTLIPLSPQEQEEKAKNQSENVTKTYSPAFSLCLLMVFHVLTAIQLIGTVKAESKGLVLLVFTLLIAIEWIYYFAMKAFRKTGLEVEIIAFFLSNMGFSVVSSSYSALLLKQFIAFVIGMVGFVLLGIFLRNLDRVNRYRYVIGAAAVILFLINIFLGFTKFGAQNWVNLGFVTIQPSELVKVAFIFLSGATLDRLMSKKNLISYIIFTGFCGASLAITGDFGTALIFFITFIVVAFIRSGDWATIALFIGGAALAIMLILQIKPYIAERFQAWGNVWAYSSSLGYQQTRAMSAAASGGFFGMGPGTGWLVGIGAADTDLVFGVLCEEWGLLIALICVICLISLTLYSYRCSKAGRSSFYIIVSCAATSMLLFQMSLNIFGCMDILPLTGVTFPFVSNGGTSLISAWMLMAFIKAGDTRYGSSFATPTAGKGTHTVDKNDSDIPLDTEEFDIQDIPIHDDVLDQYVGLYQEEYQDSNSEESYSEIMKHSLTSDDTIIFPSKENRE